MPTYNKEIRFGFTGGPQPVVQTATFQIDVRERFIRYVSWRPVYLNAQTGDYYARMALYDENRQLSPITDRIILFDHLGTVAGPDTYEQPMARIDWPEHVKLAGPSYRLTVIIEFLNNVELCVGNLTIVTSQSP